MMKFSSYFRHFNGDKKRETPKALLRRKFNNFFSICAALEAHRDREKKLILVSSQLRRASAQGEIISSSQKRLRRFSLRRA